MSRIVWLASYPKSGNTWVRVFLNNYLNVAETPVDINDLEEGLHAGSRKLFDLLTGLESSDLTSVEIDRIRPLMYRQWAAESDELLFVKVHDAWRCNDQGQSMFPAGATALVVYIMRNPLDLVSSLANHYAVSLDEAIAIMADSQYAISVTRSRLKRQLPQLMGAWHDHVLSWIQQSGLPLHLLSYEDLLEAPTDAFRGLLQATGLTVDEQRLAKAVHFSSFAQLQAQEKSHGFKERLPDAGPFFRRGQAGAWRKELTPEQAARVIANHGPTMRRFGYADAYEPGALARSQENQ